MMNKDQVTLLHLSDLHIRDGVAEQEVCRTKFLEFLEKYRKQDRVDYVVITGDIMYHSCNGNYEKAEIFIQNLLDVLHLSDEALFVVPGNHDRNISDFSSEEDPDALTRKEVGKILAGKGDRDKLWKGFEVFREFSGNYNKNLHIPDFFKGCDVPTGICMREEHKLCFVLLNTEWSYLKPEDQSEMKIGNRLIQDIRNDLQKLEGYRVVTLMHRSFRQFAWEEVYGDEEIDSSMQMIIDFSDLILAGHGHTRSLGKPDLLKNKTQLLETGAFGALPEEGKHVYKSQANILKLDFRKKVMEVRELVYRYGEKKWIQETEDTEESRKFLLEPYLYPPRKKKEETLRYHAEQYPVIFLVKDSQKEIERIIIKRIYGQNLSDEQLDQNQHSIVIKRVDGKGPTLEEIHVVIVPISEAIPVLEEGKWYDVIFYACLDEGYGKEELVELFRNNVSRSVASDFVTTILVLIKKGY